MKKTQKLSKKTSPHEGMLPITVLPPRKVLTNLQIVVGLPKARRGG
jgi:hypothetical protein